MIFVRRVILLIVTLLILISIASLRHGNKTSQQQTDTSGDHQNPVHQKPLFNTSAIPDHFGPKGELNPAGQEYTRGLVIGRLSRENTTWLDTYLATTPDTNLKPYLYVVDDQHAPLHTPMNKGNEAMVYLTYILDHYDSLPDISIFMHPHQKAWHTPELLNHDATEILKRLNTERVIREGYMNLRCHWDPGCPERVYLGRTLRKSNLSEEIAITDAWDELFPGEDLPFSLGAPCCAQFAVARHRIQSIPKENFHRYRNWLLRTPETDWTSGRVFEYLWQKIFAGVAKLCPDARACYCDGYAICFSSSEEYENWFDNHHWWREATNELEKWNAQAAVIQGLGTWKEIEAMDIDIPIPGRNFELRREIDIRFARISTKRSEAIRNGTDEGIRRMVLGF